jgi:hypothetical protein
MNMRAVVECVEQPLVLAGVLAVVQILITTNTTVTMSKENPEG